MKTTKIYAKPHSLFFAFSAALFLQFLVSVAYFYVQAILFYEFDYMSDFGYLAYCLAVILLLLVFMAKKRGEDAGFRAVSLWFLAVLMYMLSEIALLSKMMFVSHGDTIEAASGIWDNQPINRLCICAAAAFVVCGALFLLEKKKFHLALAGANLGLFCLFVAAFPSDPGELLLFGDEKILRVASVVFVREIGILTLALNMLATGIYETAIYAKLKKL